MPGVPPPLERPSIWTKLAHHVRDQRAGGASRLRTIRGLPRAAIGRFRLRRRRRHWNTTTGFGRFDLPLLVSYPRSGTNWIRFFVESVSGRPTPGETRLVSGQDYVLDRAHNAEPVMHRYAGVLLVVRDYRECLLRHHERLWPEFASQPDSVRRFLTADEIGQPASWYIANLRAFDRFDGRKLLVHYEDLVTIPEVVFPQIAEFLGLDRGTTSEFVSSIQENATKSIAAYTSGTKQSYSAATRDLTYHSRNKLNASQGEEFDSFFFSEYPELATRYLTRYDTRQTGVGTSTGR